MGIFEISESRVRRFHRFCKIWGWNSEWLWWVREVRADWAGRTVGVELIWFLLWTSNFSGKAVYIEAVFGNSSKCIIVEINSLVTWFPSSIKLILLIFKILPMWGMWKGTQLSAKYLYFEMCVCICTTHPVPQTPLTNWDSAGELASGVLLACQNLTSLIPEPNALLTWVHLCLLIEHWFSEKWISTEPNDFVGEIGWSTYLNFGS